MTESKPHTERPLAAAGLISYRYRGFYDWIMIGARDDADAFREASRSTRDRLQPERLEVWSQDEDRYIQALKPVFQTQANTDGICAKIFELDKNFKVVAYDEENEVRSGLCLWTSSLDEAKAYAGQFGEPVTTGTQRKIRL